MDLVENKEQETKTRKDMKIIHCCIWGDIELSDLAVQIIDTIHFQRLHYIKQTGLAYKVFPTATASRFEHSLGVYHITKQLLSRVSSHQPEVVPSARVQELLCVAGLVHDLGHGPFSHLFDQLCQDTKSTDDTWSHHEYRSGMLFRDLVSTYEVPLAPDEIDFVVDRIHTATKTHWYDTLISNPFSSLDTDKLDYVIRDSFHFGMKFHYDITRILQNCRVIDNELCFCERIHDEIQLFFQIRERMHRSIYRHPKLAYFESHVRRFFQLRGLTKEESTLEGFLRLNDVSMLEKIPWEQWRLVETRKAPPVSPVDSLQTHPFRCNQWRKAQDNIRYYARKSPWASFTLSCGLPPAEFELGYGRPDIPRPRSQEESNQSDG